MSQSESEIDSNAKELFDKANDAFAETQFDRAVELYTEALKFDLTNVDLLVSRAHAHIKRDAYQKGKEDAERAIELAKTPEGMKRFGASVSRAYLRSGVSSFNMGEYEEAKKCFIEGQKHQPTEMGLGQWVHWCDEKMAKLEMQQKVAAETEPPKDPEPEKPKPKPQPMAVKYDFYQTETSVVIEVRVKGLKKDDVAVDFTSTTVHLKINNLPAAYQVPDYELKLNLCHAVAAVRCSFKVLSTKVEIRLEKVDGIRWPTLESDGTLKPVGAQLSKPLAEAVKPPSYPSKKNKDWDRIAGDIDKELAADKPEGEEALNELFQKIYCDADDSTKRAMNKSFQESGGTVLSTNWEDIGKKKTDVKPPDGMEFKKWDD